MKLHRIKTSIYILEKDPKIWQIEISIMIEYSYLVHYVLTNGLLLSISKRELSSNI